MIDKGGNEGTAMEARALAAVYQLLAQAAYEQRRKAAGEQGVVKGERLPVEQRPATSDGRRAGYQVERPL